jgi:hypothetical protein
VLSDKFADRDRSQPTAMAATSNARTSRCHHRTARSPRLLVRAASRGLSTCDMVLTVKILAER